MRVYLCVGLLSLAVVVCAAAPRPAHAAPGHDVAYEVVLGGSLGSLAEPGDYVFRDAASWCAFWEAASGGLQPLPPAPPRVCPEVDFRHEIVVAIVGAPYPTSCSGIRIDAIARLPRRAIEVDVVHSELVPDGGCGCLTVLTQPHIAVVVSGRIGDVEFAHESVQTGCGLVPAEE